MLAQAGLGVSAAIEQVIPAQQRRAGPGHRGQGCLAHGRHGHQRPLPGAGPGQSGPDQQVASRASAWSGSIGARSPWTPLAPARQPRPMRPGARSTTTAPATSRVTATTMVSSSTTLAPGRSAPTRTPTRIRVAVSPTRTPASRRKPRPSRFPFPNPNPIPNPDSQTTSHNWSGYARRRAERIRRSTAPGPFPSSRAGGTFGIDAAWVGVGGVRSRDLIQAGTQQTVSGTGNTQYEAWLEMLPGASRPVPLSVHAGDSVSVSIAEQSTDAVGDRLQEQHHRQDVLHHRAASLGPLIS